MDSNYSLADIRAATEGENGFGNNNGAWWIIILFLFMFGANGRGMNGTNDALTQEVLYGQQFQNLDRKIDATWQGICSSTYDLNNSILTEGRALQTQIADCCCTTNRNIDSVRYDALENTNAITSAIHAEGEATRSLIKENEIQALRDKVAELSLAQSQCAQNAYLTNTLRPYPVPAYASCNPIATTSCYCG